MTTFFVTGIDTDSGKTLVSAILCEALHADYWKPIQAGLPRDSETVRNLLINKQTIIHPERHLLQTPASPHAAAKIDNVSIKLNDFQLPKTQNNLIIEGAGGCLVPINDTHFVVDLISRLNIDVILVADLYLGSINHTLLTVEALKHRSLRIRGIIFNGQSNPESERIILAHTKIPCLLRIPREQTINKQTVLKYANQFRETTQ
ncbi:MAG TPA: dethiobiotin synthase [Chryseosolibacter sp.]